MTDQLVRVLASGDDSAISSFYKAVLNFCTDTLKLKAESLTTLSVYEGYEPDWSRYESMFNTEQISKGTGYLKMTYDKLEEIDKKFGVIGKSLQEIVVSLNEVVAALKKETAADQSA
jgi:hypothetical protein